MKITKQLKVIFESTDIEKQYGNRLVMNFGTLVLNEKKVVDSLDYEELEDTQGYTELDTIVEELLKTIKTETRGYELEDYKLINLCNSYLFRSNCSVDIEVTLKEKRK